MRARRLLIVNADDFGLSEGVNQGILEAHERGIVTSASLMVRPDAAEDAVERSRAHPALSLGLHLDLGEWAFRDGAWVPLYEVVRLGDAAALTEEVTGQLAAFRDLVGRDPTHLDSHQHVHCREPARGIVERLAHELDVPLRHFAPGVRYCGRFYGQTAEGAPLPDAVSVEALATLLAELEPGVTELACHPGRAADLDTMYREERARELDVLCDARIRATIAAEAIELRSFGQLPAPAAPGATVAPDG